MCVLWTNATDHGRSQLPVIAFAIILPAMLFWSASSSAEQFDLDACERHFTALEKEKQAELAQPAELSDEKFQDFVELRAREGIACTPWYTTLALGIQFLPDYEEGKNGRLDKQRFYGKLNADALWGVEGALHKWDRPKHVGIDLEFLGTAAIRDSGASSAVLPSEFNDISSSLVANLYAYWELLQWDGITTNLGAPDSYREDFERCGVGPNATARKKMVACLSSFGPVLRMGAVSREKLDENDDALVAFGAVGLQYRYEDYKRKGYRNGFPAGIVSLEYAYFEEYAQRRNQRRFVASAGMRIVRNAPVYFAYRGNYGSGPDEYTVGLIFVFGAEKLLSLF